MRIKFVTLAVFLCQLAHAAYCAPTIELYYIIRPPYMYKTENGTLTGLWIERTEQSFRLAGVPFEWREVPAARLFEYIKGDHEAACTPGYYRTPDREAYALFPDAVMYQSKPHVALARRDNGAVMNVQTADALLINKTLTLLKKSSYSYGDQLDRMIASHAQHVVTVNLDNVGMARMIAARRVDYMFISGEEGEALLALPEFKGAGLAQVPLADMQGSSRYLLCSKKTGVETIDKLTRAIRKVGY